MIVVICMLKGYWLLAFGLTYRTFDYRLIIRQLRFMHMRNDIMSQTHKVGQHE